jgi:hypothetical protein
MKMLPQRIKSYLEYKTDKMNKDREGDFEFSPKTLDEIEAVINEAIDHARFQIDGVEHFNTLNRMWDSWNRCKMDFIILSVALASLKYRTKEDIENALELVAKKGL